MSEVVTTSSAQMQVAGELVLRLRDVRHLFSAPPADPFTDYECETTGESGMDRIARMINRAHPQKFVRLVLIVGEALDETERANLQAAISRHCEAKLQDNADRLASFRRHLGRSVWTALIFLAICMGLAALVGSTWIPGIPDAVRVFLAEGFTIIGWVSMWNPVDRLLYEWQPITQENSVYRMIRTMDVDVHETG